MASAADDRLDVTRRAAIWTEALAPCYGLRNGATNMLTAFFDFIDN
jgi:hypothetical protein